MHDMNTIASPRERSFTVSEYHRLAHHGILRENDRVELLDGRIYEMNPIGSRHAQCVRRLTELLVLKVTPRALVSIQNPVRLDDRSEPEPDVALLEPKEVYGSRHPRPDDVLLLIEVARQSSPGGSAWRPTNPPGVRAVLRRRLLADTTLDFDRDVKPLLYARAGVRELWVLALEEERVHVYRRPGANGYAEYAVVERGAAVDITALPEVGAIPVAAMLD